MIEEGISLSPWGRYSFPDNLFQPKESNYAMGSNLS
jgi:hypothetical protein